MKFEKLLTTVAMLLVVFLSACKKDNFTEIAGVCPMVIVTDPADKATNVPLTQVITITFNEKMDPKTITEASITLHQGSMAIIGDVFYSGVTASFTPSSPLSINTSYTGTVKTLVKDEMGNALQVDYVWTFSTGTTISPTVISTDPFDGESKVILSKVISATFSEAMDGVTITGNSFTLRKGTTQIAGVVNYSGNKATFTPSTNLQTDTIYTATITTDAKNLVGTPLASDYVWKFSTGTQNNPTIDLRSVARFGMISGVAVSNNAGASEIHDLDIGVFPGVRSSITGFFDVDGGPGLIFNGGFFAADDAVPIPAMLLQAKLDLTAAYLAAEGATSPAPAAVAGDLGGQTLAPGIYKSTSSLLIQSGDLTLDAKGDPNAVWIFQIASDFTTKGGGPYPSPAGGNVILSGGAQAKNIFWQVGSSAVIGDYTSFKGNVLALTSVTMNAYSQAVGRMLCSNGAVTLTSTNFIYKP